MTDCPKCKKTAFLVTPRYIFAKGYLYRCHNCGFTATEKDIEEGNACAACGETALENESLCEMCYNKEMSKEL